MSKKPTNKKPRTTTIRETVRFTGQAAVPPKAASDSKPLRG